MCVYKYHAFIYFLRPPPWSGTSIDIYLLTYKPIYVCKYICFCGVCMCMCMCIFFYPTTLWKVPCLRPQSYYIHCQESLKRLPEITKNASSVSHSSLKYLNYLNLSTYLRNLFFSMYFWESALLMRQSCFFFLTMSTYTYVLRINIFLRKSTCIFLHIFFKIMHMYGKQCAS